MRRVLDWRAHQITESRSILAFEKVPNQAVQDRYLTVNGGRAYYLGLTCETCQFLFEATGGNTLPQAENLSPANLAHTMSQGLTHIEPSFLDGVCGIVPNGDYIVALLRTSPRLVKPGSHQDYFAHEQADQWGLDEWGLPNYPKVTYYRGDDALLGEQAKFFEFVVPLYPTRWLDLERVAEFERLIRDGATPTALALSVLDIKQEFDSQVAHWCLAHYVIDGHHKLMAASQAGLPVTILAFIALKEGVSTKENLLDLLSSI